MERLIVPVLLMVSMGMAKAWQASPPPVDLQMQAVLNELATLGGKPIEGLTPAEARRQPSPADAVASLLKKRGKPAAPLAVGTVADRTITGPAGPIAIRVYSPAGQGPWPVLLYIHGGGWVIADIDTYDASARALTNAVQAVVVSTHYRQAPEHKFPAAHEDTFAAYRWTLDNAASIGGDPRRVAVAGESAGGNLAAGIAIRARDEKVQTPLHQLLIYPVADASMATPSYGEHAMAKPLNKAMMAWFFRHVVRRPADLDDARIALVKTSNLAGLAPATIINAEIDPLRSEGEIFAEQLRKAGVPVRQRTFAGVAHEFFGMGAIVNTANDAVAFAAEGLKKAFGSAPTQ